LDTPVAGAHFDDVRFAYPGGPALLRGITTFVDPGEAVVLLGPNGAGKTTLTKLLVGLLQPDTGSVWVGDLSTRGLDPADLAHRVGYVFQHPRHQIFARTVFDEVAFGPRQLGVSPQETESLVRASMGEVGLEGLETTHPYDLPPVQQKLVCLASALAQRPSVLVLDEPTQGFDRRHVVQVARLVRRQVEAGRAVLAVSHDLTFTAEAFDRACVLVGGKIVSDTPADEFVRSQTLVARLGVRPRGVAVIGEALGLPQTPVRIAETVALLRKIRGGRSSRGSLT
jgi:energy-coupling factor transport system ATP-binding protein